MDKEKFIGEKESLLFYEKRYNQGYMEDWDPEKKKRVIQLLRALNLPVKGKALDFGCGNGVLTHVIKVALPEWDVYGCDVSEVAVKNASGKLPDLNFFFHDGSPKFSRGFDLIFTHHVFEHVFSLAKSWEELAAYGNNKSIIIHILPCGNEKSFEYNHCQLFDNGIDKKSGNRFFYEDAGHLRRMKTEEMEGLAKVHGYNLFQEYYANQHYGALNWISNSGDDFTYEFTNTSNAKDEVSKKKILRTRRKIQHLSWAYSYSNQSIKDNLQQLLRRFTLKGSLRIISMIYARMVAKYYKKMADLEWRYFNTKRNGSEMFLFFKNENQKN